jgi:hypothetical protein
MANVADRVHVYSARTDSAGRFTIPGVRPGEYLAGFFHPKLDALGVSLSPRMVTVSADGAPIALAIPAGKTVLPAACGARAAGDSSGAIAGVVRNADTGAPIDSASVVITWSEIRIDAQGVHPVRQRVPVKSGVDGSFLACNLPGDDTLLVSASARGVASGVIEVHVPVAGITWRDLALGDSASVTGVRDDSSAGIPGAGTMLRGSARLRGVVHDSRGKPASNARVLVWGTGLSAQTDSAGRFVIDRLPSGTFSVEARAIGFAPTRVPVELSRRGDAVVALTLDKPVNTLSRVTVYGKAPRADADINGFLQRKQQGFGRFVTAADIEKHGAFLTTDALRMTPGVRVVPSDSGFGNMVLISRGTPCPPSVYLDGMPMYDGYKDIDTLLNPNDVAGIEVYAGAGAPPQYAGNTCGAVLIWTKR